MSFNSLIEVRSLTDVIFSGKFVFEDINPVCHFFVRKRGRLRFYRSDLPDIVGACSLVLHHDNYFFDSKKTGSTRFELAIFGLTGRRVHQATPRPRKILVIKYFKSIKSGIDWRSPRHSRGVFTSPDDVSSNY